MKRVVLVLGIVTAAVAGFAPAASADHVCVTSDGRPVACTPHPTIHSEDPNEICVTVGGSNLVCVF